MFKFCKLNISDTKNFTEKSFSLDFLRFFFLVKISTIRPDIQISKYQLSGRIPDSQKSWSGPTLPVVKLDSLQLQFKINNCFCTIKSEFGG